MFRRLINVATSLLRQGAAASSPSTAVKSTVGSASIAGSPVIDNAKKMSAHNDLVNAVKVLSQFQQSQPLTKASDSMIQEWNDSDPSKLSTEQIEALARAYFDGSTLLTKDQKKSFELWTIAAERGSLEAKYSRALCYLDGLGVDADDKLAFSQLEALAGENYHLAHVRTYTIYTLPTFALHSKSFLFLLSFFSVFTGHST